MEIRGNLAYLTVGEQISSELPSPIRFDETDVVSSLRVSVMSHHEALAVIHADVSEGLPHERARAVRNESVYGARSRIYKKIATELVMRGHIDAQAVEDIR